MTITERINTFIREVVPNLPKNENTEKLTAWLHNRNFFESPASTKYHGANPGGLFEHSLCVMRQLVLLTERNGLQWQRLESPYIVGFFHDLCKIDQYKLVRQDENGAPVYAWANDCLLRGHGEKSVMLLCQHMSLTEEEVTCIRYHMGAFIDKELWNDYTRAVEKYPNVLFTHTADMMASHIYDR